MLQLRLNFEISYMYVLTASLPVLLDVMIIRDVHKLLGVCYSCTVATNLFKMLLSWSFDCLKSAINLWSMQRHNRLRVMPTSMIQLTGRNIRLRDKVISTACLLLWCDKLENMINLVDVKIHTVNLETWLIWWCMIHMMIRWSWKAHKSTFRL